MISTYQLKSRFQEILRPTCFFLHKLNVTPNHITLLALVFSSLLGLLLFIFPTSKLILFCYPIILLLRMALNAVDGLMAREFSLQSKRGAVLNEFADVISDAALYLPFAFLAVLDPVPIVIIVVLGVCSEVCGLAHLINGDERCNDGPMGKSDRALAFGVLALGMGFDFFGNFVSSIFLWILVGLLMVTICNRIKGIT